MNEKLVIGKIIRIPAMRRGLCAYKEDGETVLLPQRTLEDMAPSMRGLPVVIDHVDINSQNVSQLTVGRVTQIVHNPETDNWDCEFVVDDQSAVDKLKAGWGVSTGYKILDSIDGGTLNAVPYDREVTKAEYLHLAIVETPRYEMAKNPVFLNSLQNEKNTNTIGDAKSKYQGSFKMLKFFRTKREEIKFNEGEEGGMDHNDVMVMIGEKEMPLKELMQSVSDMEAKKQEAAKQPKMLNADDEVEHEGKKMKVHELVKKYQELMGEGEKKEQAEPKEEAEKKEQEGVEIEVKPEGDDEKEQAMSEDMKPVENAADEKKEEEAKKNFNSIKNAPKAAVADVSSQLTLAEKVALGKSSYGSK